MSTPNQLERPGSPGYPTADDCRALLESFAQAFWETDAHGIAVTDSPGWRAYTGQSPEEWLSQGWVAAVHPDDRPKARELWQQSSAQGLPLDAELRLQSPGGGWRWTNVRASQILNPDSSVKKWMGIAIDISSKKLAEEASRQTEESYRTQLENEVANRQLLQATLDSSPAMIQVFEAVRDEQGRITDFIWVLNNHTSEQIYGDVIHRSLLSLNPGVIKEGIFEAFRQVVETGVPDQSERHYVHEQFNGWFYQSAVKLNDGVTTTTIDITARKKAEQELAITKERLQTILDSSLYVIQAFEAVRDASGRIIDFTWVMNNRKAIEQNGDVIGKSLLQQNPGVVQTGLFDKFVQVVETGVPIDHDQFYNHEQFNAWFYQTLTKMGDGFVMNTQDITARKKAELEVVRLKDEIAQRAQEAIRQSEERYRTLLQNLPDYAIYRLDSRGIVTEWTEGAQRMKGYTAEEVIGRYASLCYTSEELATGELEKELEQATRTGRAERESIRIRKNGERFWVNEIATAIYDAHGKLAGFTKISRDITKRKQGQELRRRLEERTRLAVEAAELATWEWHLPTDEVFWNEQHFHLLALPVKAGPQKSDAFLSRVHPEDRLWVTQELTQAIDEQSLFDAEFRMVREDAVTRWMSGYGRVTGEEGGQPTQMSGVMFDITDRKQAEEAIKRSEERLQRALSISTVGVIYFDLEGHIHDANEAFQRMSGYPHPAFVGGQVRWDRLTPPEFMEITLRAQEEYRTKGENTPYEKQYIRPDGSRWWGLLAGRRLSQGEYVEFVLDMTESKQNQQALREADRRKDEFLAMLAHELRNPMATLRNGLHILTLTAAEHDVTRSTLAMMTRQNDHLVRMVDDLLDVSRISQDKIELRKERVDLVELVSHTAQAVSSLYQERGRSLHLHLPAFPIYLDGDSARLTQIVTNLLSNGARYTNEQGQVWLTLEHRGQEAILQVRDNGVGLAADQQNAIFELFVQVDNSLARSQGGLGLGLTLVKRLVEMHGGRVEVESEGLGNGSTFTVYLPTQHVSPDMPPERLTTNPAEAARLPIIVVDDNADAALSLQLLLQLNGYQTHTRNSGRAGFEAAEKLRPAVMLLDINMPELDGYETCRLIRQQPWGNDLLIIALTGYGQPEDKQRTQKAGFDGHLVKPVDMETLTELLTTLLGTGSHRLTSGPQK
ncbi:PAS domain S-box protein [Larkinella insperata]|uniref:histidine kinase n=1 Tax=Larkinella insperata TaxID=332158 RepID=A0ABW3QM22_9BACT|nr:PAS domain S-box protein [Larkinella insperata]